MKEFRRYLSIFLCAAMLLTSFPMSGFAEEFKSREIKTNGTAVSAENYASGNMDAPLRMPMKTAPEIEPAVAGRLVDVNQYSKVYQTGSRSFTAVFGSTPNYYLDEDGEAQEYDNSLTLDSGRDSAFTSAASDLDVRFSTDFSSKGITFDYDDVKIRLIPIGGSYDTYLISDNAVRYNNVFDGVDVQYTVDEQSVREYIILGREVEKNAFSYNLDLNGHYVELSENVLFVYDSKRSDKYAYTISAPVMTDAAGVISKDVVLSLKGDMLTITADPEWLHAAERAYPVIIDPDITIDYTGIQLRTVCSDTDRVYVSGTPYAYGYAGYMTGSYFGVSGQNLEHTKMIVDFDYSRLDSIPEGAGITSAEFCIFQYVGYPNAKEPTDFDCFMINSGWSISDYTKGSFIAKPFTTVSGFEKEYLSSSRTRATSSPGYHHFDVRTAVNSWVNWPETRHGLLISSKYGTKNEIAGAFITPTSSKNIQTYADNKPYLKITWEIPNPVDTNYPLDNTTINLRTISTSNHDGKLAILGVFADGVAKPNATVKYVFSDAAAEYQTGETKASTSYKYPDSSAWNDAFASQGRATRYKDILSNWQTAVPFTKFEYNKVYNWTATASFGGERGNTAKSPDYLVYKVTRYDTLASIARYYGVPLNRLATDNHVQDMLLVENNTIIVIDPTQNATIPYNPGPLTDDEKMKIDGLLIGRAKHCEFGFEPVNLNTGNFYMSQTDISIQDYAGDFAITRSYNSKNAAVNSVFGRGWQFAYSESLAKLANGEIIYRRGDGSTIYFTYREGKYECAPGYYLDLTAIPVETKLGDFGGDEPEEYTVYEYEIKNADGEVRRFSSQGLLKSIKDKRGFSTTLSYDELANLTTMVSPAGITYRLSYDADGRITGITVPNGSGISYAYDDNGNLISYTNEIGDVVQYKYDSNHRMTSWLDGEERTVITNVYDDEGRVTKQTDALGNVTTFEYGAGNTKTTDANGNVTTYNYDDLYRTTSIEYADGSTESKTYDADNNLAKVVARNGNATEYAYNADGFTTEIKRFDGKTQTYTYDADNNVTAMTDFDGNGTAYTYDARGNLLTSTDKKGNTESYTYDNHCRLTQKTDANGNATQYAYDGIWVSKITDASGAETQFYYNANGQIVTKTDVLGNTTRFFFDQAGKNLGYQAPDDTTVSYTYDKAGCLKSLKNANGYVYTYEYDGIGNITKLVDPLSNEVVYEYDGLYNNTSTAYDADHKTAQSFDVFSQVLTSTDEEGGTTTNTYDKSGNVVTVKDPVGNTTTYTYDLRFNKVATATDALGNCTTFSYDDVGNLLKATDANGAETTFEYDAAGNNTKITYASGLTVEKTYDKVGNLLFSKSNAGENTTYTYDAVYNLTSVTYANGAKLIYTYDALGQKLSEKDSAGAETKYTYDALGRKASVEDAIGRKTTYAYDGNGNVLSETTSNGGVTSYTYDALDRMVKMIDALGNATVLTYDNVGNMISTTNAAGETTQHAYSKTGLVTKTTDPLSGVMTYTYDANGNLTKAKDAGGYEAEITYDAVNRTKTATDALGLTTTFTYDGVGNLVEESNNNGVKNTYAYDAVGNLLTDTDSLGNETNYTYDLNGNLLTVTAADGTITSYAYDVLGNLTSLTNALSQKTMFTYDVVGNLTKKVVPNGGAYTYSYDKVGRMISVVDPEGLTTQYAYNEFDEIIKTTDANGNDSTAAYDIGGNLISETDQNGHATKYTYDNVYRLIKVAYADGSTNQFAYDANGNVTSATDANGNTTTYKNDALGNAIEVKDANGGVTAYTYDGAGNVLTQTDALGAITEYTYDKAGQLTKKVLANHALYTYTYDALGRTTKETQPDGLSTEYQYDSVGNTIAKIDQSGRQTKYTYDALRRMTSTVDAMGNETKLAYDASGNLASLTSPKGNVTAYTYDKIDRLTRVTNPVKATETYTYDGVGNVLSYSLNGKRTTSYAYDKVGNMTKLTNAAGSKKTLAYDVLNRLSSETDFKGKAITYTYDANGNLTTQVDRVGNATQYTYDKLNNLLSETDAEGRNKKFAYDAVGQLISVTEANSATSTYTYDAVGNLTSAGGYTYTYTLGNGLKTSKDALGNVTEYIYDANGMLKTVKNADGSTVNYAYDKIDELISKQYDGGENVALYGYDPDGNRVSMTDIAGTADYAYDENGRITAITLYDGKSKITYTYNEFGELAQLGYPDGTSVSYVYDDLGQLVSITNRDGLKTSYKYDANGNVTEVHRPNNTYTKIKYDQNDRVTELTNYGIITFFWVFRRTSVVTEYKYEYDKSGNITEEDFRNLSSYGEKTFIGKLILWLTKEHTVFTYKYDGRNQLVFEEEARHRRFFKTKRTESTYTYDVSGNRTQDNIKGTVTDYTYNEAGQLVKKTSGKDVTTYTYDVNGNLIRESNNGILCAKYDKAFTYNNENRLEAVKNNGKLLMAALYDGDNERIFTVSDRDGCGMPCVNDKNCSNLKKNESGIDFDEELIKNTMLIPNGVSSAVDMSRYDFTGYINNINAEYTQVLLEYGANNKVTATYEYGVFREGAEIDGKDYFYEYDGRGSVVGVADTSGLKRETYRYDPYGNTTTAGLNIANPFQYNAEYTDDVTGYQYLRARYYRAQTGSFITADTYAGNITNPLSLNRYTYTHNNPINGKDPSGNLAIWDNIKKGASSIANWVNNNVVKPVSGFLESVFSAQSIGSENNPIQKTDGNSSSILKKNGSYSKEVFAKRNYLNIATLVSNKRYCSNSVSRVGKQSAVDAQQFNTLYNPWSELDYQGEIHNAVVKYLSYKHGLESEHVNGRNRYDLYNQFTKQIWEVKPISYKTNALRARDLQLQLQRYYADGVRPGTPLGNDELTFGDYEVKIYSEEPTNIYYSFSKKVPIQDPEPVPVPVPAPEASKEKNKDYTKEVTIGTIAVGALIIAGTIAEDIFTGGAGIADDAASIGFGLGLMFGF